MKRCTGCQKLKPEADFYDGRARCMRCMRVASSARYWRDPEPQRQRARERKARLRERM